MIPFVDHTIKEGVNILPTVFKVLLIVLCVLAVVAVVLYFVGRRMQRKQAGQQKQIDAAAQNMSLLIIDKKKMKLKDAGLPAIVLEQTPRYLRGMKLPVVKAKAGPKIMSFICDANIFDMIPLKKTVKATVSGIYITAVKAERGTLVAPPKKKGFAKLKDKFSKKN